MKKLPLLSLSNCLVALSMAVLSGNTSRPTLKAIASPLEIGQGQPADDSLLPLLIIDAQGADSDVSPVRPIPPVPERHSSQGNSNPGDRVELPPPRMITAPEGEQPQTTDESLPSPELPDIPARRPSGPAEVRSVRISPTGQVIASGDDEDDIQLWDIATGEELHTWRSGRSQRTQAVDFTPDGNTIVAGGVVEGQIRLWQWQENSRRVHDSQLANSQLANTYSVTVSPDGERIATGHSGGVIHLWNREMELIRSIQAYDPSANVVAVEFAPNGERLASRGFGGSIGQSPMSSSVQILEISTGEIIQTFSGNPSGGVDSIAYSPAGDILAGYYEGIYEAGTVRLWNPSNGDVIADLQTDIVRPHAIAFSSDGAFIAIAGLSDRIEVWSVQSQAVVQTFTSGLDFHHVYSIDFAPNSSTFVTSGVAALQDAEGPPYQGTIMIWSLAHEDGDR
jgi:WD40 repeat protein